MELILLERVEKLGQMGDVVDVKPGYARNYLLPQKKALRATAANKKYFESQRVEIEAKNLEAREEAEGVAKKMDGMKITLLRQAGETGQLYGSATSRDIANALKEKGYKLGRAQVILSMPIKELGVHQVTVRLHAEVTILIGVNVARSDEEAEMQLEQTTLVSAKEVFESKELAAAAVDDLVEAEEPEAEPIAETADGPQAPASDEAPAEVDAAGEKSEEKPQEDQAKED
jgi:large subunit ribosomal protein L9